MKSAPFRLVPRTDSLQHRLNTAKDADGKPAALLDELMVLLEDPPPDTPDRWQAGADLCASHDIATSRMSVWRFYRAHVLQWRREHTPALAQVPHESTNQLLDQARHLAALRVVESLHDPHLAPGTLVGLVQNENRRQELQLARDQFDRQCDIRDRLEHRQRLQRVEGEARARALYPFQIESLRDYMTTLIEAASTAPAFKKNPASSPAIA